MPLQKMKRFETLRSAAPLSIYYVGSYVPRRCGIATFTYDLAHAVSRVSGRTAFRIIAVNNRAEGYDYPEEVAFEIDQNRVDDYRLAAEYVNFSGVDAVCLQHEFGLFGGPEGSHIRQFLGNLSKPVVSTFHTVLQEPPAGYRKSLCEVADLSDAIVVMSRRAVGILEEVYGISPEKVHFIHHGVPDVPFVDSNFYKDLFQVEGRLVLLTFGLLNPNKGIETVIKALPEVVRKFPNIAYIVLGATHPEIKKMHGEEYRISLQRRVIRLGLENHVFFHNRFVSIRELCEFIGASDVYITPYLSREQITSGTLAYAIGMGKAVVSTPYCYAAEMLQDGRGELVDFGDFKGMAAALIRIIGNDIERHNMRKRAYRLGRQMTWESVGREYIKVFRKALQFHRPQEGELFQARILPPDPLPEINLNQILRLTDDTGIIRYSLYGIPDRKHGYSTGDAAIAMIVALKAYRLLREEEHLRLANLYLSFLRYAQTEEGRFRKSMSYARQFTEEETDEDTLGKSVWGLGCAICLSPSEDMRNLARELFERSVAGLRIDAPLAKAYAILGFSSFLHKYSGATAIRRSLQCMADELAGAETAGFQPFELAKISQALISAHTVLENVNYKNAAIACLDFICRTFYVTDYFDFSGNGNLTEREDLEFPADAGYLVEAFLAAYQMTREKKFRELARAAFDWFFGRNRIGAKLYDFSSGACYDGLAPGGINLNQGAESTLTFLLANLAMSELETSGPLPPPHQIGVSISGDFPAGAMPEEKI